MAYKAERFTLMLQRNRSKSKVVASVIVSLVLIGLSLAIAINRQFISDMITVWQFKPGSGIVELADRSGMNDYGKFIYLASKPELDLPTDFNTACDRIENTTSILGCYSNHRIYLYDVTDPQLDGIREVTAAHETLHAIYLRLSSAEKEEVGLLLEAEFKKLETDDSFQTLMEFYDRTEPGQRDNELHSIIGTEVNDISPELETYYSKYFSDRKKVVALDDKYSSVFEDLSNKAENLVLRLNELAAIISKNTENYNSNARTLNSDILAFNNKTDTGLFTSEYAFYLERSKLVARVSELDDLRTSLEKDTSEYDTKLAEYNSISSQSKKLYDSIDSTLISAPAVELE